MTRRIVQLYSGLFLYGLSSAMMVRSGLGLNPWDVLHEGLATHAPVSFGTVVIMTGAVVLLLWVPLRQRPGIGTISNIIVIGLIADLGLGFIPSADLLAVQALLLIAGIIINGVATSAYIGAHFGPGPRDGLMMGLADCTDWPIRSIRTGIELTALCFGWVLGGTVGVGTVAYAVAIGPIVQSTLKYFDLPSKPKKPGNDSLS